MSTSEPPPEGLSPSLHLDQFAPDQAANRPPTPADENSGATAFIKRAAAETVATSARPVVAPGQPNALPPKSLLGVVAYCYAKGVYSSEEIEERMTADPTLRAATGNELPDAHAIRRFRRLNREAVRTTLEKFFRHVRAHARGTPPPSSPNSPPPAAPADSGSTTIMVRKEAAERVAQAVLIDSVSQDT